MPNILGPVAGGQVTERPARSNGYGPTQTWWKGCSAPGIEDGTVVDPDALNDFLAQLLTAFTQAGITLDGADDMLWRSMRAVGIRYGVDIGGADTLQAVFNPAPAALTAGLFLAVKAAHTNTGAVTLTVTLADTSTATKSVKRPDGSPLQAADWPVGMVGLVVYDGTNFQLIASMPSAGSSPASIDVATAPFFPEVLTSNGKLTVTSGIGSVVIGAGQSWQWRGLKKLNTDDFLLAARTFATAVSKTYHLRWHAAGTGMATPIGTYPNGRFVLRDVADAAYNPTALVETHTNFDSTYDDMLVAKVVTDGANSPTVTTLVNLKELSDIQDFLVNSPVNQAANNAYAFVGSTLNWSRTPLYMASHYAVSYQASYEGGYAAGQDDNDFAIYPSTGFPTRYALSARFEVDYAWYIAVYVFLKAKG